MEKKKMKLSRQEKVNESDSFSFTWDTQSHKKASQGIVFKKKPVKIKDKPVEIPTEETIKPTFKSGYVKRKHRKDKILTKKGEHVEFPVTDKQKKAFHLFSDKESDVYVNAQTGKSISEVVFTKGSKFADVDIHKHLVSNLEKVGLNTLTNVQEKSIPTLLEGKDTLIRSQTGSGKTLAYAIPIMDALLSIEPRVKRIDGVQVVIVVPTRELALQTHQEFQKINTFQWIVTGHLCGGENRKSEKDRIRKGITILIGTPGRLLDHALHTSALDLSKVRCLVLDEADQLLDMGFRKDIVSLVEIIDSAKTNSNYNPIAMLSAQNKKTTFDSKPPLRDMSSSERQTILLSATLTKDIKELAELTTKDHVYIDALDEETDDANFVIPNTVCQEFLIVPVKQRLITLSAIIVAKSKKISKLFVFMGSTHMVEFHYELFKKHLTRMPRNRGKAKSQMFKGENVIVFEDDSDDEEVEEVLDIELFKLHGNMDQKERKEVFVGFKQAKKGVLICTDVASRGLDVPEADCIIQYTPPQADKDYLHRIGRTGRAGKSGSALIFLTPEEREYIAHLNQHRVFLKKADSGMFLSHLCDITKESNVEEAATALQRHFEREVEKDKSLYKSACFAYSTWSRFYNSHPADLRAIFDFKRANLGHYVTSFALTVTPTEVSKAIRDQTTNSEKTPLNKKLANHEEDVRGKGRLLKKRKNLGSSKKISSDLEPLEKKKKKQ